MGGLTPIGSVPTYTAQQVRDAELPYLEASVPLMKRASAALADVAAGMVRWSDLEPARILVLVGSGNNGGDALYAAAELARRGATVLALPVAQRWHEAAMGAARDAGVRVVGLEVLRSGVFQPDLVIDGILGTGTSGDPSLRGQSAMVVEALMGTWDASTSVLAVDIPSGIHPDTGKAGEVFLPADVTLTFGGVKHGLIDGDAGSIVGKVILAQIGIEEELLKVKPFGWTSVAEILKRGDAAD